MGKVKLLVDTDVLIDFFNRGFLSGVLAKKDSEIYYSVVSKKELLAKRGLRRSERDFIVLTLERFRVVPLSAWITERYLELRKKHPRLEKEDALIAATALVRKLPLLTRNWKHYRQIDGLVFFTGPSRAARVRERRVPRK